MSRDIITILIIKRLRLHSIEVRAIGGSFVMAAPTATAATSATATRLAAVSIECAVGRLGGARDNRRREQLGFLGGIAQRCSDSTLVCGCARG